MTENNKFDASLSPKWQRRFEFFAKHERGELPNIKSFYGGAPLYIRMNWIAFWFGFIYFFVLGLWRKNLTIWLISFILNITLSFIVLFFEFDINSLNFINIAVAGSIYGTVANKAYYLHKVKGSKSWNPFEGLWWRK